MILWVYAFLSLEEKLSLFYYLTQKIRSLYTCIGQKSVFWVQILLLLPVTQNADLVHPGFSEDGWKGSDFHVLISTFMF